MGAWIEILDSVKKDIEAFVAPHDGCVDWNIITTSNQYISNSRTPRWVRGLKFIYVINHVQCAFVAPHDGCVDWNTYIVSYIWHRVSRTPRWVRGLKFFYLELVHFHQGRTPRWVRGLKLWLLMVRTLVLIVAPHDGCVDWNCSTCRAFNDCKRSHPTMGAWIEIQFPSCR